MRSPEILSVGQELGQKCYDALTQKVREGGRIENVAALVATGVSATGFREILGLDLVTSEDGAGWLAFVRSLVARGLSGVRLVISDAHPGPVDAIASTLPGASWHRCRTHFPRNLLAKVPKSAVPFVATLVCSIFVQPDRDAVWVQFHRVINQLAQRFPAAAEMLSDAGPDILAFTAFPQTQWKQIWSNNPQERLNKEIRRRTDVVGIFPNRDAAIRLIGMVLAEQHDEWQVVRRYMSADSLAKARARGDRRRGRRGGEGRARRSERMIRMTLWSYTTLTDVAPSDPGTRFTHRSIKITTVMSRDIVHACSGDGAVHG